MKQLIAFVLLSGISFSTSAKLLEKSVFLECGQYMNVKQYIEIKNAPKKSFYPLLAEINFADTNQTTGVRAGTTLKMQGDFATAEESGEMDSFGPAMSFTDIGNTGYLLVVQRKFEGGDKVKANLIKLIPTGEVSKKPKFQRKSFKCVVE